MTETPAYGLEDLERMRMGVSYIFTVQIRGFKIQLRPIEVAEQMQINQEVLQELEALPPMLRNPMNENFLLAKKILEKASIVDPDRKIIGSINSYLIDRMTVDEMMFCYNQYLDGTSKCNPSLEEMKVEDIKYLVEEVKKNPEVLTDLSSWQLQSLVRHLLPPA